MAEYNKTEQKGKKADQNTAEYSRIETSIVKYCTEVLVRVLYNTSEVLFV